ncbi:RHS repeat-associated core domain-containing protein [Chloroflexus aurantiacus]
MSTYDALGNLTRKTGVGAYACGANENGTGAGPHQARTVGGQPSTYDANGTLLRGDGRRYTWAAEHRPVSIQHVSRTATDASDADGARVARTYGFTTTVYLAGRWEDAVGTTTVTRTLSRFHQTVVTQREQTSSSNTLLSLRGDHLGSISVAPGAGGTLLSQQDFDPWGKVRNGGISQTSLNDTGQRLDGTGLVSYHARYDDPDIGRFRSADTIIPGSPPLTVWTSDTTAQGMWRSAGSGPVNPQDLNRYTYALNNPLKYTDPTGHCPVCIPVAVGVLKLVDYGWTAWDIHQSAQVLSDPNASTLDRHLAELNIILALSLEAGEPDDILPVAVPADDVTRRGLIRAAREALAAGDTAALNNLPGWLRPIVRGMATEDRMLAQLDRQGQKRLLEVRLGTEVVKTILYYIDDKVIGEIKDVAYLSADKQIQAQVQYALEHGLVYELHIRPDTKLSEGVLKLLRPLDEKKLLNLLRDVPVP